MKRPATSRIHGALCLTVAVLALCGGETERSRGAEFRSRAPHVHGNATLDIAVQDQAVEIEFESPAINVIGFEHTPVTREEKAALRHADATFQSIEQIMHIPPEAACQQRGIVRAPIAYEQDGDDEKPNAPQADYRVTYTLTCAHPQNLDSMIVKLFAVTMGIQKISVRLVSPALQREFDLSPSHTRIDTKASE